MPEVDVLIVGAGLAGLTAADELVREGLTVTLLDKSSGPGGRLATRRIADATLDHGAQFFTVRSDEFERLVARWDDLGAPIERWSTGFAEADDIRAGPSGVRSTAGDGHPRYAVRGGMNALAKVLAAHVVRDGAVLHADARAVAAWVHDGVWHVATADGGVHTADLMLATPPVPQTTDLLRRGATTVATEVAAALDAVAYDPCLALLAVTDADPGLPDPGGIQFAAGPVRWLSDNARKPVSGPHALTVHAAASWSRRWYDSADEDVEATLRAWLAPWLDGVTVSVAQLKRWRYAQPVEPVQRRTITTVVAGAPVAFAGDAFGEAKVEGAARSGRAAAAALIAAT